MTTTTLTVLGRPERPYDSRDPAGPNPLNPNENNGNGRYIFIGHPEANVATLHVTVVSPSDAGVLLFWDGSTPRPSNVASVNFNGPISQSLVTVPVVDGHVVVHSDKVCHLILDLQAVGI